MWRRGTGGGFTVAPSWVGRSGRIIGVMDGLDALLARISQLPDGPMVPELVQRHDADETDAMTVRFSEDATSVSLDGET
jgi:hypothetical protein